MDSILFILGLFVAYQWWSYLGDEDRNHELEELSAFVDDICGALSENDGRAAIVRVVDSHAFRQAKGLQKRKKDFLLYALIHGGCGILFFGLYYLIVSAGIHNSDTLSSILVGYPRDYLEYVLYCSACAMILHAIRLSVQYCGIKPKPIN